MTIQNPPIFVQAGSHPAEDVRRWIAASTNDLPGVVAAAELAVTERAGTSNMSVDVAGGRCFIAGTEGTYQGTYFAENRGSTNLPLAAADSTNGRIDLVVVRVRDSAYSGGLDTVAIEVVTGTPAIGPVAPTAPSNSLQLAVITVPAGATSVVDANISDSRVITGGESLPLTGGVLSGDLTVNADTATERLLAGAGTALLPSIAFGGDDNTGAYSKASNTIGFTTAGTDVWRMDAENSRGSVNYTASMRGKTAGAELYPAYAFVNDVSTGMFRRSANEVAFSTGGTENLRLSGDNLRMASTSSTIYNVGKFQSLGEVLPSAPQYTFQDDPDTGMYRITTNQLGFAVDGQRSLYLDDNGQVALSRTYGSFTTAAAANLNIAVNGRIFRSTSSGKFKANIEPLETELANKIVDETEWVYYQSTCTDDNSEWRHLGAIAEQIAPFAPWLLHWAPKEDCGCETPTKLIDGVEHPDDRKLDYHTCELEPTGIMYERFVAVLGAAAQNDRKRLKAVETELADLKARLDAAGL